MVWADRGDPDAVSVGDQACLSFPPELLRFLESDMGGGLTPGAGFAPRWILPLTAAASASNYVASPRGRETLNSWKATRARLVWTRPCANGETVEARARIVRMGQASIRFHWRVESAVRHDLLAEGDLIFVSRDGARAKPPVRRLHERLTAPAEPSAAVIPSSAAARRWPLLRATARGLLGRLRRRHREVGRPASAPLLEEVRVSVSDPTPPEVYYVAGGCSPTSRARERATTAGDLLAPARALLSQGRGDDLWAAPAECAAASAGELRACFERRLAECTGPGVRILRAPAGGDCENHVRYVRALHPRVHVATVTEAVLALLDYHTPRALAIALPASHCRGDGLLWQHPVRILGRGIAITPEHAHRVQLGAAWWEPGEVREMAVMLEGALIARRAPGRDEPPAIEFLAERHAGYELRIELHPAALGRAPLPAPAWPPASERSHEAEAGRFLECPAEPVEVLAGFEAPFLIDACRAHARDITAGDSWSWVYPAGLLRLLYNPIGGGAEPLGRRAHPLGAIAAAAAVHAAAEALGAGWTPHQVSVRWRRPIDPQAGFLVHARACRCDAAEIEVACRLEQPPAALADVSLILRATPAGGGA